MNKKAKRITVAVASVLCLLLVLALSMGVAGAWYEAKRTATGTVTLDKGIIIDYAGFSENAEQTTWDKGTELLLFETISGKPNAEIAVPAAQIAKNAGDNVIDYYVRAKVNYTYYLYNADRTAIVGQNDVEYGEEGAVGYTADEFMIDSSARFVVYDTCTDATFIKTGLTFADTWTENGDWHYYTNKTGNLVALPTDLTAIFDGNAMVLEDWTSEFGGPLVKIGGDEREVAVIVATLTIEAVQPGAEIPANLNWAVQAAAVQG